jgi:phosphatidylserine decarboxylase
VRRLPGYVRALPRRALSRILGVVGRAEVPRPLLAAVLGVYARAFGADMSEAERPLGRYRSFLDFFTRRLRPGVRSGPSDPLAVASPADCRVHATSEVRDGTVLQVKGARYAVADLLGSPEDASAFEGGTAATLYLAPGDYHRFHWPFDGTVEVVRHLPGDLWPVHPGAVANLPGLFAKNERVACLGHVAGGGRFAFVPVGALNVGSIRLEFHPLRTNRGGGARRAWRIHVPGRRGDPFGWFEFGSAIVLLLAPDAGTLDDAAPGTRRLVGHEIGRLRPGTIRLDDPLSVLTVP